MSKEAKLELDGKAYTLKTLEGSEGEKAVADQVMEMLELFRLTRFRDELATSLPYGDQRRLEIVRALATKAQFPLLPLASIETVTPMLAGYAGRLWISSNFLVIRYLGVNVLEKR